MRPLSRLAGLIPPQVFVRLVAWQYRFFEPELRYIDSFVPSGRAAVDVGVWWGPWSWWLARRASEVHAFEPNKVIFDGLSRTLPDNVHLYNLALSDRRTQPRCGLRPVAAEPKGGHRCCPRAEKDGGSERSRQKCSTRSVSSTSGL